MVYCSSLKSHWLYSVSFCYSYLCGRYLKPAFWIPWWLNEGHESRAVVQNSAAATTAKSLQSCPTLCSPLDGSPWGSPIPGFSRQEHWSELPFPSPMHESEKWKLSHSVVSDSVRPHRRQPTRLPCPWILQARTLERVAISFSNAWKWKVKVKSLSRVRLFATPWTAAHQAPPSMGFSRQEYWSGWPFAFRQIAGKYT